MKNSLILLSLLFIGCQEKQNLLPKEEVPLAFIYEEGSAFSVSHSGSVKELIVQVAEREGIKLEFVDFKDFDTELKFKEMTWRVLFEVALYSEPVGYTFLEGKEVITIMPIQSFMRLPLQQIAIQPSHLQAEEVASRLYPLADYAANESIDLDPSRNAVVFTLRSGRFSKVFEILNRIDKPSPTSRATQ
ncbi:MULTISPECIES: hypothetical protein [unclassified Lentimonas]|uniref:hypothetical protein n=1 Tax=unclassified Lentimonas TaxID=2630993 RepID=UPI00132C8183|nr:MULTISPECIES: hypothetical protein [unclassified Lentimonas]CAA6696136.1 Unannotated [Lentimonas sp. CC10]CAA6697438.1 Unannotated [Lentimonas sp. CC19]CAA7072487.1 Unannotated [Lentimonas sp. CC11]